jgi:hypothetical protein
MVKAKTCCEHRVHEIKHAQYLLRMKVCLVISFYYFLLPLHVSALFSHLQAKYTILVFGNYYTNNKSAVLYSISITCTYNARQ